MSTADPRAATCDMCSEDAAYVRKYSGESLCVGCFSSSLVRKTARTISRYGMIGRGERVCVAVSGGKDSLALLHVLKLMSKDHDFDLRAITIDEGIPGYREEALGIVREYCTQLDIKYGVYSYEELFELTLDEALQNRAGAKTTSCSICGVMRRRAMEHAARDVGAGVLATAHNLDDALQTFLINMASGDTKKIGWMGPASKSGSPRRIKPFCEIYESELVFYAFANEIPFQSEPCPHMDEGVRTEIREFLNRLEEGHSGVKNGLYRSAMKISGALSESGDHTKKTCPGCGAECTGGICSVCKVVAGFGGKNPMQI